ncbi:alpha-L-fucosidase [Micromonospora sp. 067-2]|uniref:alpha-L-fucosidase n=1 Tax=Micromonospora sp. 067-2 TaxID=2789270 RepID=UPI003978C39D
MASSHYSQGRSAAEWALHQILDLIQARTLGPGDRLPPERDLGTQLGVSRGSVREAISALVTMGVLEARHGAGVFVTSLEPVTVLPSLTHVLGIVAIDHAAEIVRLHGQVEGAAAARAAARSTPSTMGPLTQALAELRLAAQEPESRGHHDQFKTTISRLSDDRFHRAIAAIAQDGVAEGMIMLLRGCRDPRALGTSGWHLEAHEALARAIGDHEPDEARNLAERLVLTESQPRADPALRPTATGTRPSPTVPRTSQPEAPHEIHPMPSWFGAAKLGIMVHWGVYTVPGWAPVPPPADTPIRSGSVEGPANQYFAEWYQAAAAQHGSATAEYHQRIHGGQPYQHFRPTFEEMSARWSPPDWVADFAAAGARYVVMVAKHHDGYLLWPSRVRHPRDERWRSPRDILGELGASVRRAGMRFGVFYSSGEDWSYTGGPSGPGSDVETSRPAGGDYARYVEAHWRELIDRYQPDGLWNDTGYPEAGDARRLIEEYRVKVPEGVVTDRFRTSSAELSTPTSRDLPWESIRPIGLSFGWNRQEDPGRALSGPELTLTLLDVVANNGNLLLGVSPDDTGSLPAHQRASLRYLGDWLARFGEAIFDTTAWRRPTTRTTDSRAVWFTCRGDDLYLIVEAATEGDIELVDVHLDKDRTIVSLEPTAAVKAVPGRHGTVLTLPAAPPNSPVTVLRISGR